MLSPEEYFVYSQLMRAGYVVDLYDAHNSYNRLVGFCDEQLSEDQKNVWICLRQLLSKSDDPLHSPDPHLKETAESMHSIGDHIRNPPTNDSVENVHSDDQTAWTETNASTIPTRKRKHDISPPLEHKAESFLDNLLDEPSVREFSSIFKQIQVIQLTPFDNNCSGKEKSNTESFKIVFDLFAGNADHRKSDPDPPTHRIVVCPKNRGVPTRQEMFQLYSSQSFRTPILVVFVNELMSMQAYVYVMSS